jgi:hypothetical protein
MDSSSLSISMLYFASVIDLLVTGTNIHCHQCLDGHDRTPNPLPDIMNPHVSASGNHTSVLWHMWETEGLPDKDRTILHTFLPQYHDTRLVFLHILGYLHFTDDNKETDKNDKNYDKLWKISDIFYVLNVVYLKFYNPHEHLAIDEMIILSKRRLQSCSTSQTQQFQN